MMKKTAALVFVVCLVLAFMVGCSPQKQGAKNEAVWPKDPVQILVAFSPGGGTDVRARIFAEAFQKYTGVPFVIVNQTSGGGAVCADTVKNAKPDGTTLMYGTPSTLTCYLTGVSDASPVDDFKLASYLVQDNCNCIVTSVNSPYETVNDLVEDAKKRPNEITLGIQIGSYTHFVSELFAQDAGIKFKYVESGSDSEKVTSLLGGHINVTNINPSQAKQYLDAGKIRILGVITDGKERYPLLPDIPSMPEQGFTNSVFTNAHFFLGPKGMDDEICTKINELVLKALNDEEVVKKFTAAKFIMYGNKDLVESNEKYKMDFKRMGDMAEKLEMKK